MTTSKLTFTPYGSSYRVTDGQRSGVVGLVWSATRRGSVWRATADDVDDDTTTEGSTRASAARRLFAALDRKEVGK